MTDQLISISVYDPKNSIFMGSKSDKARCRRFFCAREDCVLRQNKQCIMAGVSLFGAPYCPYGRVESETGFTPRAKGYHTWVTTRKHEQNKVGVLQGHPVSLLRLGTTFTYHMHTWICARVFRLWLMVVRSGQVDPSFSLRIGLLRM